MDWFLQPKNFDASFALDTVSNDEKKAHKHLPLIYAIELFQLNAVYVSSLLLTDKWPSNSIRQLRCSNTTKSAPEDLAGTPTRGWPRRASPASEQIGSFGRRALYTRCSRKARLVARANKDKREEKRRGERKARSIGARAYPLASRNRGAKARARARVCSIRRRERFARAAPRIAFALVYCLCAAPHKRLAAALRHIGSRCRAPRAELAQRRANNRVSAY